ncbi:MAG: hypothetical protein ACTSPV_14475 [Candidatus Hodarchaeales archaeon]
MEKFKLSPSRSFVCQLILRNVSISIGSAGLLKEAVGSVFLWIVR